jgi:hypothetical protein
MTPSPALFPGGKGLPSGTSPGGSPPDLPSINKGVAPSLLDNNLPKQPSLPPAFFPGGKGLPSGTSPGGSPPDLPPIIEGVVPSSLDNLPKQPSFLENLFDRVDNLPNDNLSDKEILPRIKKALKDALEPSPYHLEQWPSGNTDWDIEKMCFAFEVCGRVIAATANLDYFSVFVCEETFCPALKNKKLIDYFTALKNKKLIDYFTGNPFFMKAERQINNQQVSRNRLEEIIETLPQIGLWTKKDHENFFKEDHYNQLAKSIRFGAGGIVASMTDEVLRSRAEEEPALLLNQSSSRQEAAGLLDLGRVIG